MPLKLHRQIGIVLAVFVLGLAITGVLINHASALGLDRAWVEQAWLLRLYNPNAAPEIHAYRAGKTWGVWANGKVSIDDEVVADIDAPPLGLASAGRVLVMAFPQRAIVVTPEGKLVETLDSASLPDHQLQAIADNGSGAGVVIRTSIGCFRSDAAVIQWQNSACAPHWSTQRPLPHAQRQALNRQIIGAEISWERVLLDVHSGRLFGAVGVWIVDLIGIGLIVLAISGALNWWRVWQARRVNRRQI